MSHAHELLSMRQNSLGRGLDVLARDSMYIIGTL